MVGLSVAQQQRRSLNIYACRRVVVAADTGKRTPNDSPRYYPGTGTRGEFTDRLLSALNNENGP